MPSANPFTDPSLHQLYATPQRLTARTSALLTARVSGTPVVDVLGDLLHAHLALPMDAARILDVGCGRGTTTRALAALSPQLLVAIDASAALIATTRARIDTTEQHGACVADFHRLPFPAETFDAAVAAFCLYHAPRPSAVIAEIARCLRPGGVLIAVTKARDSYHELDHLLASTGLDPGAPTRPSLYASAHSHNITTLAAPTLTVRDLRHDRHRFRFTDLGHLARYLVTTPKYDLAAPLRQNPGTLADELRRRCPDGPIDTSSTVTYLVGARHD
ncbi:class I SAM-dependent methyltransferase [Spiractinospora alimapuensis]|uniref:class I SAM-dependent methyltransferase n=1 Tax=Spiractinospora alimapuensis TaxID=2820884 RepID=UPI001F3F38FE|nr:class I SAM-dependent methyltransferase [Spiractinospora alimapuensis]QVQ53377.1 class I SAM-dependent methyltransferase [Spiractinospora alimapuensis]